MTGDVDRERLKRLRGDLAELRARAKADQADPTGDEDAMPETVEVAAETVEVAVETVEATPETVEATPEITDTVGPTVMVSGRRTVEMPDVREPLETPDDGQAEPKGHASRPLQRSATPRRNRVPRPPRRNPFRRRAHRPPDRLAVPVPIPVARRSVWSAAPRWPTVDWISGSVIAVVMVPVAAQLVFRLWTATTTTSFLAGADPSRADYLQAAAGVAGGAITAALGIAALAVVRGRVGYLAGAGATLLMFGVFPYLAYTANAGIVSAPLPSVAEMVSPTGWPRGELLGAVFLLAGSAFTAATIDFFYRGASAVRDGLAESRR